MSDRLKKVAALLREQGVGLVGVVISPELLELETEERENVMAEALEKAAQDGGKGLPSFDSFLPSPMPRYDS